MKALKHSLITFAETLAKLLMKVVYSPGILAQNLRRHESQSIAYSIRL